MAAAGPTRISVRAYQVGFGDCFLLTFHYPSRDRHVLIDCGSTAAPKNHTRSDLLMRVAEDIKEKCNGKLQAVVATHRHADHINGFERGTKKKPKSGDVLRSLAPELVIQPWTEDPDAEEDAVRPTRALRGARPVAASLNSMHALAEQVLAMLGHDAAAKLFTRRAREQLEFIGRDNVKNVSAVENLMTMARDSRGQRYVYHGDNPGLGALLPGVKVHVLGPPTVEQSDSIKRQRSKDEAEFWHLLAAAAGDGLMVRAGRSSGAGPLARAPQLKATPAYARWLVPRMQNLRGDQLLQIVTMLDSAMNNTSVILLIEAGRQKLLFPGDAQLENWLYALRGAPGGVAADNRRLLAGTTFYKVGHHGSLNATPKSLWALFRNRSAKKKPRRLISVVSTMAGKHGDEHRGTEVPREKLVEALKRETEFITTQSIRKKSELAVEVQLETR